jgi:hypothetical protein
MGEYKQQLLRLLIEHGWELEERVDGEEWWLEEAWKIRSTRQRWGYEIYLVFLVDPMDAGDKKRRVWAIAAFESLPVQRPLGGGIATMDMQKGRFDEKVRLLVGTIDAHRNAVGF